MGASPSAIREYLCVTLSFDHDIIVSASAARFVSRLRKLVESGYGLHKGEGEGEGEGEQLVVAR